MKVFMTGIGEEEEEEEEEEDASEVCSGCRFFFLVRAMREMTSTLNAFIWTAAVAVLSRRGF